MPAGSRRCLPQYSSGYLYQNQLPCGHTHHDSIYLYLSVYIPRSPAMRSLLHTSRKWAFAYVTAHTQIKSIYACFSILQSSTYHIICPQRRCHARRYTCSSTHTQAMPPLLQDTSMSLRGKGALGPVLDWFWQVAYQRNALYTNWKWKRSFMLTWRCIQHHASWNTLL